MLNVKYAEVLYDLHLIVSIICCDKRLNIDKKARFIIKLYNKYSNIKLICKHKTDA